MPTIANNGISQGQLYEMLSETVTLVNALKADLTAVRASVVGVNAKLDADAGVSGTDYASLWNPAAMTATTTLSLTTSAD